LPVNYDQREKKGNARKKGKKRQPGWGKKGEMLNSCGGAGKGAQTKEGTGGGKTKHSQGEHKKDITEKKKNHQGKPSIPKKKGGTAALLKKNQEKTNTNKGGKKTGGEDRLIDHKNPSGERGLFRNPQGKKREKRARKVANPAVAER